MAASDPATDWSRRRFLSLTGAGMIGIAGTAATGWAEPSTDPTRDPDLSPVTPPTPCSGRSTTSSGTGAHADERGADLLLPGGGHVRVDCARVEQPAQPGWSADGAQAAPADAAWPDRPPA